jgi:GTP cyclohydrolase I
MKKNKQVLDEIVNNNSGADAEDLGDDHIGTAVQTPLREDAFDLSDEEKIKKIESHFHEIMQTLGLDLNDESLSGTPHRVAKMYVKEIFQGLNPKNRPDAKKFNKCLDSKQTLAAVEADIKQGQEIGVKSTPTFFVNGQLIQGAQPIEVFSEIIDAELK